MATNEIHVKVYGYKTKYPEGFIKREIEELLKDYPGIHMDKFNDALMGNTCMMRNNEVISYHCDIEKAIVCGTENRRLRSWEWD